MVVVKFDREDTMMENYQLHMQFLEKLREVIDEEDISFEELLELPLVQQNRKVGEGAGISINTCNRVCPPHPAPSPDG